MRRRARARPARRPARTPTRRPSPEAPPRKPPRKPPAKQKKLKARRPARPARRALVVPTAKAGIALAVVTAAAVALGSLLGLPSPIGNDTGGTPSLASSTPLAVGAGTDPALADGPYHPIKVQLVNYGEVAAKFGGGRGHEGQDMFAGVGTPLVAVRTGEVVDTSIDHKAYVGGRGNYIAIYSPQDNRSYVYFHMKDPPALRVGDDVTAGQELGRLGCTGSCDGPHLHFEIRNGRAGFSADTKPIDPLPHLKGWPPVPGAVRGDGAPQSPPYKEQVLP